MKQSRSLSSFTRRHGAQVSFVVAAIGLLASGHRASATAQGPDACTVTSKLMRTSCKHEKKDDFWRTRAICQNLPTPLEREACMQQAARELHDALEECDDVFEARQDVCQLLGGGIYAPAIDPANFVAHVANPYMPLVPGTTTIFESQGNGSLEHIEVTVTHNTRVILGVTCTEVHDVGAVDGEINEDTLDWFAQDLAGNVWYFGENSKSIEADLVVSLEGSWEAGVDGAKPGIIMRAQPEIGLLYRQEFALGDAEDVARLIGVGLDVTVPFGAFHNCWQTEEFAALEPDVFEQKFYAPGIGVIRELDPESGEVVDLIDVQHN